MKDIILIGGGGHCKACIDVIELQGNYIIKGIIDVPEKLGTSVLGYNVIGNDSDIPDLIKDCKSFLITVGQIGNASVRSKLFELLKSYNVELPIIVSPLAYVSKHAEVREGTIIMHHALINAGAKIGANCIINNKALLEHDVSIGNHCHISTGAIVNGGVNIGANTFYGSGAVCKQYINIDENSFVKANSIVK